MSEIEHGICDCEWRLLSDPGLQSSFRVEFTWHPRKALLDGVAVRPIQGLLYFDVSVTAGYGDTLATRFTARNGDTCYLDGLAQFRDVITNICRNGAVDTAKLQTWDGQVQLSITGVASHRARALVNISVSHPPAYLPSKGSLKPEQKAERCDAVSLETEFEIDAALLEPVIEKIGKLLRLLVS